MSNGNWVTLLGSMSIAVVLIGTLIADWNFNNENLETIKENNRLNLEKNAMLDLMDRFGNFELVKLRMEMNKQYCNTEQNMTVIYKDEAVVGARLLSNVLNQAGSLLLFKMVTEDQLFVVYGENILQGIELLNDHVKENNPTKEEHFKFLKNKAQDYWEIKNPGKELPQPVCSPDTVRGKGNQ